MKKISSQLNKGEIVGSNGIIIDGDIQFLNYKNRKSYFRCIQCLILVISSFCSVFMMTSYFTNIDIDKRILGFFVITLSFAFFFIKSQRKTVRYLSTAYIAAITGYILYYIPSVIDGFYVVLKAYITNAKIPNNLSIDTIDPENYLHCATYFFIALSIIIIFLHFIALVIRIDFPLLFLTTFPLFEIGAYWGFQPTTIYVFGVVTCWIVTLSMQIINHNSNKTGRKNTFVANRRKTAFYLTSKNVKETFFQTFIVFVSLICIGVFAFVTYSSYLLDYKRPQKLNEVRNDISDFTKGLTYQDFINALTKINPFSSKANGGLNEGKLGNADEIKFNGLTALEIKVPLFRDTLYLKGYTAGEYKNNRWISNDDPDYARSLQDAFYDNNMYIQDFNYYEAEQTQIYRTKDGIKAPDTITITIKNANKKYVYAPYMALYSDDNTGLEKTAPKSWENIELKSQTYQLPFYNIAYLDDKLSNNNDHFNDLYLDVNGVETNISEEYDFYASYAYMDPMESEVLDNTYNIIRRQIDFQIYLHDDEFEKFWYFIDVKKAIQKYFQDNYQYTLAPGKTPDGEDFIDYFLSEQNKGYCTYFASAGTMLMRKFGFPARYVEGYTISPTELKNPDENGLYTIAVKDKSAHAWTEVFIKEIGWVPCEFTPGYGEQIWSTDDSSSKTTSGSDSSSKSDWSSSYTTSTNADADDNSTYIGTSAKKMFHNILTIASTIVLFVFLVLFIIIRRKYNLQQLRKSINDPDKRKCMQNIHACCLKYLKLISITNNKNITDKQFASQAEKLCSDMNISNTGENFALLADLAVKSFMSNEGITFEECAASRQMLKEIRNEIFEKCLTRTQKFKAKWFYNLY
ncbi:MAG: transglutaminase-like domain-containing protein [Ruminococcus sp.]|nr:transglutaminase-like domain-containing protein [Ruminococcus sp.]